MNITMASEVPNRYTHEDYISDQGAKKQQQYDEEVSKWLRDNPEVGSLNSGEFYVCHLGIPEYVEAFASREDIAKALEAAKIKSELELIDA